MDFAENECRCPGSARTESSVNSPACAAVAVFAEKLYRCPGIAVGDNWV